MKLFLIIISLFFLYQTVHCQNFISDSMMQVYLESGVANEKFMPKGKSKNEIRTGKWKDYSFEFIHEYREVENDFIQGYIEHYLIYSTGNYIHGEKWGEWKFHAVEAESFKKVHIATVNYKNGKKEGPMTLFFASGEKSAVGRNMKNQIDGELKIFYKNGALARTLTYRNGKAQGGLVGYFKSGKKRIELEHNNGYRDGIQKTYYESGALMRECVFKKDSLNGTSTVYYENGKPQEIGEYKMGKIDHWKYYYESGQLWIEKEYADGKYRNILQLYDKDGETLDHGTLKDGTGTVKYYTLDAKVYLIRTFENGKIIKEEEFD